MEDVRELQKQIAVLSGLMQRWYGVEKLPSELEKRIQGLFLCAHMLITFLRYLICLFQRELSKISNKLQKITSQDTIRRIVASEDDAGDISRLVQEIDQLVQSFQVHAWHLQSSSFVELFDWQFDGIISIQVAVDVSNPSCVSVFVATQLIPG